MPRNVRNWWLDLTVDGRANPIQTGPRAADGGFALQLWQRSAGQIVPSLHIEGRTREGIIMLRVRDARDGLIYEYPTGRDRNLLGVEDGL